MTDALSDFERMTRVRLPNWAHCGRQDSTRPAAVGAGSVYQLGRADGKPTVICYKCLPCSTEQQEPGRCGVCGAVLVKIEERILQELPPPPPDVRDAEWIDTLIAKKIPLRHRSVLLQYYGSFFYPPDRSCFESLGAAVRALLDAEDESKKKVIRWVA